jgi:hypothetical protein
MRNGHDVLRGALIDCDEHLEGRVRNREKFVESWAGFIKWMHVHALMEDGTPDVEGKFGRLFMILLCLLYLFLLCLGVLTEIPDL